MSTTEKAEMIGLADRLVAADLLDEAGFKGVADHLRFEIDQLLRELCESFSGGRYDFTRPFTIEIDGIHHCLVSDGTVAISFVVPESFARKQMGEWDTKVSREIRALKGVLEDPSEQTGSTYSFSDCGVYVAMDDDTMSVQTIDRRHFDINIIRRIQRLPNVRYFPSGEKLVFAFDGGYGVTMPIKREGSGNEFVMRKRLGDFESWMSADVERLRDLLKRSYIAFQRPNCESGETDSEIAAAINDAMSDAFGSEWLEGDE